MVCRRPWNIVSAWVAGSFPAEERCFGVYTGRHSVIDLPAGHAAIGVLAWFSEVQFRVIHADYFRRSIRIRPNGEKVTSPSGMENSERNSSERLHRLDVIVPRAISVRPHGLTLPEPVLSLPTEQQ